MWSAYAKFIVRHPYLFLFIISVISTVLTVIPLVCHKLPSFSDPLTGFETRGTTLAHRFIAWENLIDETRPSRRLAVNPQEIEDQLRMNLSYQNKTKKGKGKHKLNNGRPHTKKIRKKKNIESLNSTGIKKTLSNLPALNSSDDHMQWEYGRNVSVEDENDVFLKEHTRKQWVFLKGMQREADTPIHPNYAFGSCGAPLSDNAHLVITNIDNSSLLTFENIQKMCIWQSLLVHQGAREYYELCQRPLDSEDVCCPVWSVPNYIALMSGKKSCVNLTRQDVNETIIILQKCAPYFHNFSLMASCELDRCSVPKYCSQYDAVYNLLFYLMDATAFAPPTFSQTNVKNVIMFMPLPSSSTVLPFYQKLVTANLFYSNLVIPAMDFGLKNTLFDLWVIEDTWLVGFGALFVFLCVWVYTKSLLLSVMLLIAITYSLGIAYFLYDYVFNLDFFPFMNLLVIVVVIGIGADDAFLYVKVWQMVGKQLIRDNVVAQDSGLSDMKNVSSAGETILIQILEETLKHSVVAIFITTLTTAVAFFASYVSYIPAINCFSIFAGTAVLVNFFLMISWLPASVFILDVKLFKSKKKILEKVLKSINEVWDDAVVVLNRFIIISITKLHIIFVLAMGAIGIYSIVVVFYTPGLQLPDSKEFQLFQSSHVFEQYDINYRDNFWFERFAKDIGTGSKMPLRWIWGVKAVDNGNHMSPNSRGQLVFDESFSMSDPRSQVWLMNFCAKIKAQPFYQPTLGPLLPNCFMESFKMYMSRRCIDKMDKIDRTPCCESSQFPYRKEIFEYCINKAMASIYETQLQLSMPGVAGPKFLRSARPPKVASVVVEFESVVPYSMSFKSMDYFFLHVENWTEHELKSAPSGMKGGWFISDFQFYDLQRTLASGTVMALLISACLGFVVLIPATLSFVISICSLSAMVFSSTVTIAILVLSGWKLNILESVAISTSAGLAVDFSLHYALSYTNAGGTKLARVKCALSTSAGPTAAAALTTGFSGIFLLRSNLLPYSQIGTFLALIMSISWIYATFFLCSLFCIFGQNSKECLTEDKKTASRVSSICSGIPNLESHELEHLADSNRTNLTHSHSPSSMSATTVVLHEDCEQMNSNHKNDKKISITTNLACEND